jgi:hypothetical protein
VSRLLSYFVRAAEGVGVFERWGRQWECLRGYAVVEPEGWFLELLDITDDPNGQVVLIARWPDGGQLSVSQYRPGLPAEIVAWFTDEARVAIAPIEA